MVAVCNATNPCNKIKLLLNRGIESVTTHIAEPIISGAVFQNSRFLIPIEGFTVKSVNVGTVYTCFRICGTHSLGWIKINWMEMISFVWNDKHFQNYFFGLLCFIVKGSIPVNCLSSL